MKFEWDQLLEAFAMYAEEREDTLMDKLIRWFLYAFFTLCIVTLSAGTIMVLIAAYDSL